MQFCARARKNAVGDLIHRLPDYLLAALRAVRQPGARKQKTHIIVYLRHRAHGGTGVMRSGLLVYGHRRRKPFDILHVRLLHLPEELARVTGQALHIPALPLRENGIEGKRRLAAARKPGEHHQLVARYLQVDVFKVIFLCAFYEYLFHFTFFLWRAAHARAMLFEFFDLLFQLVHLVAQLYRALEIQRGGRRFHQSFEAFYLTNEVFR